MCQDQVGCTKDMDCREPRVCDQGSCVDPRPVGTSERPSRPASGGSAASAQVAGSPPFAMFGGDARHTGRRGGPAPTQRPKELWKVDVKGVRIEAAGAGEGGFSKFRILL